MQKRNALAVSALALMMAAPLHAQGALTGVDSLDDRIDDIQEDVNDELTQADRRDRYDNQYAQGWSGSVAAGFSTTSGNTDTADLDMAAVPGTTPLVSQPSSRKPTAPVTRKNTTVPMT